MDRKIKTIQIDVEEQFVLPYNNFKILSGEDDFIIKDNTVYPIYGNKEIVFLFEESREELHLRSSSQKLSKDKIEGKIFKDISLKPIKELSSRQDFIKCVDVSILYEVLEHSGKFYNSSGERESIFFMLKNGGFNTIRLRLWNCPYSENGTPYGGGNNNLEHDMKIAKMASVFGFDIMIDFHYSDFWADPKSQRIPKEWSNLKTSDEIANAVSSYTEKSLNEFKKQGVKVKYVQIGNEITNGLITQTPAYDKNDTAKKLPVRLRGGFYNKNLFKYLNAGISGAKKADKDILTVIHIDTGAIAKRSLAFFKKIKEVPFDIIGLSYYPFFHGEISKVKKTLGKLIRFNKPIFIAETSYAFTKRSHKNAISSFAGAKRGDKSYPVTPKGQAELLYAITKLLMELPNNLGKGVSWWEPCWLPLKGVGWSRPGTKPSWSDQALFSYDGVKLPSVDVFKLMEDANK